MVADLIWFIMVQYCSNNILFSLIKVIYHQWFGFYLIFRFSHKWWSYGMEVFINFWGRSRILSALRESFYWRHRLLSYPITFFLIKKNDIFYFLHVKRQMVYCCLIYTYTTVNNLYL
jgi:hypothetical protein